MKSLQEHLTNESRRKDYFAPEQNYKYWIEKILRTFEFGFESYENRYDVEVDDIFSKHVMDFASKEGFDDALYCLYRCWQDRQFNDAAIDKLHLT